MPPDASSTAPIGDGAFVMIPPWLSRSSKPRAENPEYLQNQLVQGMCDAVDDPGQHRISRSMARIEQQRGYSPPGGEANLYQSSRIIAIVHTNQRRRGFNNRQIGVTHRGSISLCGTIGELPNLLHRPPGAEIVVLEGALD